MWLSMNKCVHNICVCLSVCLSVSVCLCLSVHLVGWLAGLISSYVYVPDCVYLFPVRNFHIQQGLWYPESPDKAVEK